MTVIVAVKDSGAVYMGCDGIASDSFDRREVIRGGKIVRRNGMLIGVSGSAKWLGILRHHPDLPNPAECADMEGWLNSVFAGWLYGVASATGTLLKNDNGDYADVNLLIGHEGEIYFMPNNFSAEIVVRDFYAIGSGRDEARALLYAFPNDPPAERLNRALEGCAELLNGIGRPFYLETLYKCS